MNDKATQKEATAGDKPPKNGQTRTRSPAYPAIDLEAALSKAAAIWEKARRQSVSLDIAAGYWGFGLKSSAAFSCLAALKKFGLAEEDELSKERAFKLSDLGVRLIYNPDTESEEHQQALKTAALLPPIHSELWDKYQGNLPDNKVIERFLVLDRKFNEKYVAAFIDEFRRTITFANLSESDTVTETNESGLKTNEQSKDTVKLTPAFHTVKGYVQIPASDPPPAHKATDVPIFLDNNKYVKVPFPLTEEDYQLLLEQLKLLKKRLVPEAKQEP